VRGLSYFDHVMSEWELLRKRHWDIAKRKNRGRPRLLWMDSINSWTDLGLVDVLKTAEDGVQWCTVVCNVSSAQMEEDYRQDITHYKLQRVVNATVHVVTGTQKFNRGLGQTLHDELLWLDVPDRVFFKLAVTVRRCLNGRAPPYLSEYCVPVASDDTQQHLRSANRQLLAVPCYWLNTYGHRAFLVAGPAVWNSLPDFIWDPTISADCFKRLLKTIYLLNTSASSALEVPDFIWDPTISADCFKRLLKTIYLLNTSASSALEVLADNCAV